MTSEDFKLFQESFFPRSWVAYKEGPDVGALLRLQGEEREKAEEMLLESLTHHHPWAPMGLGELRSQKASLPLKSLLNQARGETLVEVAMALWKIEEYPQSRDYIIAVLRADDPSLFDSLGVHAETLRDLEKLEEVLSEEGEAVSEEEVCNGEFE